MDNTDCKIVISLNKTRNITKTADITNLTQSAVSKRISNIEKELGSTLAVRSHNGIRFTPSGEKVLEYCTRILSDFENMKSFLKQNEGKVFGSLTVGVSDNYMLYHLSDLLYTFHGKYPNVNLKIHTEKGHVIYPLLVSDEVDIAIIRGDYRWDGYKQLLSREMMCVVYDSKFKGKNLNDLEYIDRTTDSVQYSMMNRWKHENGIVQTSGLLTVDSISSCMDLVKRGLGWALIPEIALTDFDGCVIPCMFANKTPFVRNTFLYCREEVAELMPAKAFIEEAVSKKIQYPHASSLL